MSYFDIHNQKNIPKSKYIFYIIHYQIKLKTKVKILQTARKQTAFVACI